MDYPSDVYKAADILADLYGQRVVQLATHRPQATRMQELEAEIIYWTEFADRAIDLEARTGKPARL